MKTKTFFLLIALALTFSSQAQERVHHLVLFKLKPGIEKTDERFRAAIVLLQELSKEIPQIIDLRAGENFSERPIAADYGLLVLLANDKALQVYLEHPAHKAAVAIWKEIADWTIADFWASAGKVQE
jgi:hypothetical protein